MSAMRPILSELACTGSGEDDSLQEVWRAIQDPAGVARRLRVGFLSPMPRQLPNQFGAGGFKPVLPRVRESLPA